MSSKHDAKLVILGASGVGKTCLGLRFVKDQFVAYTASTIGASFLVKEVCAVGCPLVVVVVGAHLLERLARLVVVVVGGLIVVGGYPESGRTHERDTRESDRPRP